jgi:putative AdoMet-dependent methyltransferase
VLAGYARSRLLASRLVNVSRGMRVVDVGIGTGAFAEMFAEQGATITGIDISPRMLEICGARHPDWRLLEGNFLRLPLFAGSQDLVISSFAFHELADEDRGRAIMECMRVARPESSILLVDIMFEDASRLGDARQRLGSTWDEENYALFPELSELAGDLGFHIRLETLSDLHGAALISRR